MRHPASRTARSFLSKILYMGIDDSTPSHLVDRVVYSNWVSLFGTLINLLDAQANVTEHHAFALIWNFFYQAALIGILVLNHRKSYFAGRLIFVSVIFLGVSFTSAVEGPQAQTEHHLLAVAAFAFTLFHPSERIWSWLFGGLSAVSYLFFVRQSGPVLPLPYVQGHITTEDLRLNQISYMLLYLFSLLALSNAYSRATKVADEQRAKLFEANKMASLGQMAGGIAHEINNPIAIVLALAEKLSRQAKDQDLSAEEVIKTSERLQTTAFRIVHIVRGLQVLSRDGDKLPFSPNSIQQIIENTVALCQERFKSIGIDLSVEISADDIYVECRAVQISQTLLNLLNNACDATRGQKDKWVKVSVVETDTQIELSVENSGAKIPRAVQEKLFQPFFTTKEVGHGTGLGLSISLAMIREHGGWLYLDENCSHTRFVISLPKQRVPVPSLFA